MLKFRFSPLNFADPTSDALAQLEISALFQERASPRDLLIDRDQALSHFIEENIEENQKKDYYDEPGLAEGEMMDGFSSSLLEMVRERAYALGDLYPFQIVPPDSLVKREGVMHPVAVAYLSIQAMRLSQSNLIEVLASDDKERKRAQARFSKLFERVFEFASAYAVVGDKGGMPIVLSNCRSSNDLHKKLTGICSKVGSGRVKSMDNWSRLQKVANDGGVDAVVHVGANVDAGNTTLIVVGATYQQKKIEIKVMGARARARFADFFVDRPAPLQGALVRLADSDYLTIEKCRVEDCLFYGYESVWRNMAERGGGAVDLRLLSRIDAMLLRSIKRFGEFAMIDDDGEASVLSYG